MTDLTIDTKHPDYEVDAIGKPCPMPLLLLKKQLKKANILIAVVIAFCQTFPVQKCLSTGS